MNRLLLHAATICLFLHGCPGLSQGGESGPLRAVAQIVEQKYCYADNEMFMVSLRLDIRITNSTRKAYYIMSNMIPLVGRVASSVQAAQAGKYLNKWEAHLAIGADRDYQAERIWVMPGHPVVLHTAYGVPARYKAGSQVAGTVVPGSYVLEVVLHPEINEKGSAKGQKSQIDSLTTAPIIFIVPNNATPKICD